MRWPSAHRGSTIAAAAAGIAVALAIIAIVVWALALRAQARRSVLVRKRYGERRATCPEVHFDAPLGERFCADALARLPPPDHPHPTAAFGADPFWSEALEWMADRVGGVARRRLYWTEARTMPAAKVAATADGPCALVIDPVAGRVTATTRRPLTTPVSADLVVIVLLEGQPRAIARCDAMARA
ncbi:hypothetical protein pdul_cds_352 [Pandoravirus dulcis]|uniref:Uncharacterized protein n=1 Tax=Pandoravirus dulcis TaxID=1349409 RepID=S4VQ18_9VIRU|nr:hypothetical protein pdul_cds_352 [Pandoravirus dulcis]AGO82372.1 hypothetical protein pdul_cds_352 [Pandoravirus dulcis]